MNNKTRLAYFGDEANWEDVEYKPDPETVGEEEAKGLPKIVVSFLRGTRIYQVKTTFDGFSLHYGEPKVERLSKIVECVTDKDNHVLWYANCIAQKEIVDHIRNCEKEWGK